MKHKADNESEKARSLKLADFNKALYTQGYVDGLTYIEDFKNQVINPPKEENPAY